MSDGRGERSREPVVLGGQPASTIGCEWPLPEGTELELLATRSEAVEAAPR